MSKAIEVRDLSKLYRLGEIGTGTITRDINRWWAAVRGKEDPFVKIGEVNDRTQKGSSEYVWSLKDISFDVEKGDVLGVIGKNGAGKSTLLKILSRITAPTTGSIKIKGRVASLLEVGTGFHPDLTGRENVYLNGAIMGMTRAEVKRKFDDIVEFSGVERYIDTPVKRYSSGMYVRLAFAVAAHLEPEVLIVDEVLAVGDAEFQKKCLGKMKEVSKNDGKTILFVSHNLPAVKLLCNKSLYLKKGLFEAYGDTGDILSIYKKDYDTVAAVASVIDTEAIRLLNVTVNAGDTDNLSIETEIVIDTFFECKVSGKTIGLSYSIFNDEDILLFEAFAPFADNNNSVIKTYHVRFVIPKFTLNSGNYFASITFGENQKYVLLYADKVVHFVVDETLVGAGASLNKIPGIIRPNISYVIE